MNPIQYDVSAPVNPFQYRWEYYTERMDQQDLPLELDLSTGSIVPMQLARLATLMIKISNLLYANSLLFLYGHAEVLPVTLEYPDQYQMCRYCTL
jgi:hypothetical protein